ncbi:MAG TPA: hypothetical protein VJO53_11420 [Candidatus Acidoferrales bacterium]|nr:hypothetical protein [Candidatus Acidoferrales bacterium]
MTDKMIRGGTPAFTPRWSGRPRLRASAVGSRMHRRSTESGSIYLIALFMVVVMVVGSEAVLQNLLTQGRRQREEELIWRGNQYTRAIRMFYRKTGHYPQTLDDLKTGLPDLHFLRLAAYKDPMNTDDGEWRLIYVDASGRIFGSVRYATLQQMAVLDANGGQYPVGQQGALPGMSSGTTDTNNQNGQGSQPGGSSGTGDTSNQNPQGTQQGGSSSGQTPPGATGDNSSGGSQNPSSGLGPGQATNPLAQLQPTGPVDGPVVGGFLTGVASNVDKASIKVYRGGKTYKQWEFIWNPVEDQLRAVQQGLSPQVPQPGQPGQSIAPGANAPGPPPGFGGTIMPPPSPPQ